MQDGKTLTLRQILRRSPQRGDACIWGRRESASLADMAEHTRLDCRPADLAGHSVLISTADQLAAIWAMIELDGVVRRLVVSPPGLPPSHVDATVRAAEIDTLVSDREALHSAGGFTPCCANRLVLRENAAPLQDCPGGSTTGGHGRTQWLLLTSGTCGPPKIVAHDLASLTAAIRRGANAQAAWGTFYDVRRFGGLQILLRALTCGGSLVLSDAGESAADHLSRLAAHNVTHVSGTPSHWRRSLMSAAGKHLQPRYVRLSGEIAEQALLDELGRTYADARICHAFASTEAGVCFEVNDGCEGFPANLLAAPAGDVEMKVVDGSLRVRSARTATGYVGPSAGALRDERGFIDTGDLLELRGGRYRFAGRRDGVINVGGLKVHPEEVEAVINRHPKVRGSLVTARRSPLAGHSVVADITLKADSLMTEICVSDLESEIIAHCRHDLVAYKVPVAVRFVSELGMGPSGKLARALVR